MASATRIYRKRVKMKQRKAGKLRKRHLENKGTTPTREAFFGDSKSDAAKK